MGAVLKVIEEPPANVYFMLTTSAESGVPRTIRSRCSRIILSKPGVSELQSYFSLSDPRLVHLADRLPARLSAYIGGASDESMKMAKQFINDGVYEKLLKLDELTSDPVKLNEFIDSLVILIRAILRSGTQPTRSEILLDQLKQLLDASESLKNNHHQSLSSIVWR